MKITASIPYKTGVGGFGTSDLLYHWLALGVMSLAFITLTGIQLARRKGG
jgi:hypothetical protein